MNDEMARVIIDEIEETLSTAVEQAAEECPSGAIIIEDDEE